MKKVLAVLTLCTAVLLLSGTAAADLVIYNTTGTFDCNGASDCTDYGLSNAITIGSGGNQFTLSFDGIGFAALLTPSTSSLGDMNISTCCGLFSGATVSGSPTFTLTINQSLPSGGVGTMQSTLTGSISFLTSSGELVFTLANTTTTIGTVTYDLLHTINSGGNRIIKLPNPGSSGAECVEGCSGKLTMEADISSVPEPASMTLLGSGLLGAGSFLRRRFRKN